MGWVVIPTPLISDHIREITISRAYSHVLRVKLSNEINRNAVRLNRKWQIQDCGLQIGSTHTSTFIHDRNTISQALSMFLRFNYPIGQSRTLHDLTGSGNFKTADSKPEVCILRLENMIGAQFQRLYSRFQVQATRRDNEGYYPTSGNVVNQR